MVVERRSAHVNLRGGGVIYALLVLHGLSSAVAVADAREGNEHVIGSSSYGQARRNHSSRCHVIDVIEVGIGIGTC